MRYQIAATPLAALGLAVVVGVAGPAGSNNAIAAAPVMHSEPGAVAPPTVASPAIVPLAAEETPKPYFLEIGGHRAGPDQAPENTLAALRKAIAAGADSVEMDVRYTAEGKPVILHDDTLTRTTDCDGFVANWKLTALLHCDAGTWFNQAFSEERIPTLDEVLAVLAPTDLKFYMHVKLVDTLTQAATLVGAVNASKMKSENVIFAADEPERLEMLSLAGVPRERLAWVVHQPSDFADSQPRWGALIVRGPMMTRELVEHVQERGQRVIAVEAFPFTLEQAKELHLDGFLADNLKAALANR